MFEASKLKRQERLFKLKQYEIAQMQMGKAARFMEAIEDPDEKEWTLIGGELKGFSPEEMGTMQLQAYKFWKGNVHGRAIIECLVKFIIGKQAQINAQDENRMVQEFWDDFEVRNKFIRRQKEIIRRTLRDGECFIRYFVDKTNGKTSLRFIDPSEIAEPTGKISHGIETDPDDIETPLKYYRSKGGKLIEIIPAEEIQHIKILADSNVKRGTSILYVVMPLIKKYEQWLNDRIILNKVRTAVALIRKIEGASVSQIESLASERAASMGTQRAKAFKPGTVITAGPGMSYEMLAPNIQAADVAQDGRSILLAITAAMQLAEYMISGDASNANYASTMVSESPAVRAIEDWQTFFEQEFKIMFRKVIQAGINYGPIPAQSEKTTIQVEIGKPHEITEKVPTDINCDVEFAPIIHRNIKEETEAVIMQLNQGLISRETATALLGHDPKEEQEKIKKEEAASDEMRGMKARQKEIEKEPEEVSEPE